MKPLTVVRSLTAGLVGIIAFGTVAGAVSLPAWWRDRDPAGDRASLAAAPVSRYVWPTYGYFTQEFRSSFNPSHSGIDIAGSVGTPIIAAADGVVTYAGFVRSGYNYGLGNMVEVRHADGTLARYAHNSRLLVREGQSVYQGQAIALMGNTGNSTGPHLHFELQQVGGGFLDPLQYLPPLSQPVRVGSQIPRQVQPVAEPPVTAQRDPRRSALPIGRRAGLYRWPTQSRQIVGGYVTAMERPHFGLDIAGTLYSPVQAAAAGEVTFAGDRGVLRNVLEIRHADDSTTVYANNHQLRVRVGQRVRQGDTIATLGNLDPYQRRICTSRSGRQTDSR
ncbi:MAG: M23 family metallopeptidase [Spirulinaceae cyanobacterium RM2_2_10]|nr:M23 family metallopeptidase [Spirulinaceae cyanobacterium RM2_2_10]